MVSFSRIWITALGGFGTGSRWAAGCRGRHRKIKHKQLIQDSASGILEVVVLSSWLILVSSTALLFYFVVETVRRLRRGRTTTHRQSGPPPESGFKTIHKPFLLPGLKWAYISPYYLRS
jgi:hypothetical protein